MQQAHAHTGQGGAQQRIVCLRGVDAGLSMLALLNQRADPVHLPAFAPAGVAYALNDFPAPRPRLTTLVTMGVRPGGSSSIVADVEVSVITSSQACAE